MGLLIAGTKYHDWSTTVWKGQLVEIEFDHIDNPLYENQLQVKVFGKTLGLLEGSDQTYTAGCRVYATLVNGKYQVLGTVQNKPKDWTLPFCSDSSNSRYSVEFSNRMDNQGYEAGVNVYRFFENAIPMYFYEWLIRNEYDVESVNYEVINYYMDFMDWMKDENVVDYNDFTLKMYHEDGRKQMEFDYYDKLASEVDVDALNDFERQFGWMEEGEYALMQEVEDI